VAERIYFDLCMAKIGSISVSEDGRTIEFQNPFLHSAGSTPISAITFEGGNACYYRDKTGAEPDHVTGLVRDVQFQLLGAGNAVRITITTLETSLWKLGRPYQLTTEISVRNPEVP
jgi:hypothetical protein